MTQHAAAPNPQSTGKSYRVTVREVVEYSVLVEAEDAESAESQAIDAVVQGYADDMGVQERQAVMCVGVAA